MATTTNHVAARALQQNRPRPALPKNVVPAIPLPFIQKRQQQQAARRAKEEAAKLEIMKASSPTPPAEPSEMVNGTSEELVPEMVAEDDTKESPASPATPSTPAAEDTPVAESELQTEEEKGTSPVQGKHTVNFPSYQHKTDLPRDDHEDTVDLARSDGHSSVSRSTYHMPPAFIPATNTNLNGMHAEAARFPQQNGFNGPHSMHQPHPSVGSVMFGGYPESNNSSPAPPPSASNMPPYNFPPPPHSVGRHAPHPSNASHMSNGFAGMGPPPPPGYYGRPDTFTNHGPEGYMNRHPANFNSTEQFLPPPIAGSQHPNNGYGPSTPHSFQGSQTSNQEQENGPAFWNQYPTAVISNGSNGHIEDVRLYQQPTPKPRQGPAPVVAAPHAFLGPPKERPSEIDQMDGLLAWLGESFANPTFTDYVVELRYTDDRAPPVRIPGHSLMLARSLKLKDMMLDQAQSDGVLARSLLIESDDRFLNSDGFWAAMQRLYGIPLLDLNSIGALSARSSQYNPPTKGVTGSQFELALGYAAAGHLLKIISVTGRGCELAGSLLSWDNIERALDFALDGGLDFQWTLERSDSSPTYGPFVNILIHFVVSFLISGFPAKFKLDTSVGDPSFHRRLPSTPDRRSSTQTRRLSTIKFGDHSVDDESLSTIPEDHVTTKLSKILLAIPFHLLKFILESPRLGNVQDWASTSLRTEVIHDVIQEREKRRIKVHQSPNLPSDERTTSKQWQVVGYQEYIENSVNAESTPTILRKWIGYESSSN
jgi:hypothetical protein